MTLFFYILLGILIIALEWRRRAGGQRVDAMTVFNVSYFALFVFVPINVMCFGDLVVRQQYAYETFGSGDLSTALSLFFCYALFCLGYWLKSPGTTRDAVRGPANCIPLRDSARVAIVIFLVGVFLAAVYAIQMGGVMEVISNAADVRSGVYVVESKYIFYRWFSPFSADAFVLFAAVMMGRTVRKIGTTIGDKVFLLCTFVFFIYYALSTGSRRPFIYPIVLCYLIYSSLGGRLKKMSVILLLLIFVIAGLGSIVGPVILSGNLSTAFDMINVNTADWQGLSEVTYGIATQGLADSYIHFVAAQKASLWQFGFLTDIANLPRDFFPSQLFGFERSRNMLGETSEFILGRTLPEGTSGEESLGLQGYLLVNFGYVGMFALFFALGIFYKWLHYRFRPADPSDAVGWLVYWWVVLGFFVYFREGMLLFVIKQQLTWWVTTAVLLHYRARLAPAPRARIVSKKHA
jgi:hypothetical protein